MNKKTSRFAFIPFIVALVVTLMPPFLIFMSATSPAAGLLVPLISLIIPVYFWLTEFRTRAHRVIIENNRILKCGYFGLGRTKPYRYIEFEGFITSQQPGRFGPKEYIFIIKEGKREVCISEFYHRNYKPLKNSIENKLPHLGEKEYEFAYEYKQMFR